MAVKKVKENVFEISLGYVNIHLLVGDDLTLIDTGTPGSASKILAAVEEIGYSASDVDHILVTHYHADHIGSLAALKEATGAPAYMHKLDADLVRGGVNTRPVHPAPGFFNAILVRLLLRIGGLFSNNKPVEIENEIQDGDVLDFADGLQARLVPGHSAGQLAFLRPHDGGVLFAADTASNMFGLGYSIIYEDIEEGMRSLEKLSQLDFETACFGHGKPIKESASARFRDKWGGDEHYGE